MKRLQATSQENGIFWDNHDWMNENLHRHLTVSLTCNSGKEAEAP